MTDADREELRRRAETLLAECLQPMKDHGHAAAIACFVIIDNGDGSYARTLYARYDHDAAKIVLGQFVKDSLTKRPEEFVPYTPVVPSGKLS